MNLLKHILVGILLPIALLAGTIYWRVSSYPNMPVFSLEWWFWYAAVVGISLLMGAGMHRYWTRHQTRPPLRTPRNPHPTGPTVDPTTR